jgi:hypothetical protein
MILNLKILIISHFKPYLYYLHDFKQNYNNFYEVTATQLTTFVPLYSCNNITMTMATIAAEACW